jgi:protein O-GlcNAc transferase
MTLNETLQLAIQHHQSGNLQQAEYFYKEILNIQSDNFYALQYLGVLYYQGKKYDLAIEYIEKALQLNPRDSHSYYNLGIVFKDKGQLDKAETCFQKSLKYDSTNHDAYVNLGIVLKDKGNLNKAILCFQKALQLQSDSIAAHYNLGYAYQLQNNLDEAIVHYQKAIKLDPDLINAYTNLGLVFYDKKLFNKAIQCYQKALQLNPNSPDVYNNIGVVLKEMEQFDEAIAYYQKALEINPHFPVVLNGLGAVLKEKGEFDKAIACYQKALKLNPVFSDAYNNLGVVLKEKGQFDEAIACYQKALELNPDLHDPYNNLGLVYREKGQLDEAVACYKKALELNPDFPDAYNGLGIVLDEKGKIDEAISCFRKTLLLDQNYANAFNNLGNAFQEKGQYDQAEIYYRHAIKAKSDYAFYYSNFLFSMTYNSRYNAEAIFSEHLKFAKQFEEPLHSLTTPHFNDRSISRRLKIGYFSPDFKKHSVAYFIEPVLAAHNRELFEIFCYSDVLSPDKITERLQGYTDQWRNIVGRTHENVAELIRNDRIDILIDLAGHTAKNRMLVFARKPAPVQITWIGYPATTGLSSIDYKIVDKYTDPTGTTEQFYTEKLIRMPESFLCYLPDIDSPKIRNLPALSSGHITFGSFNNFAKVSPEVMKLWANILKATPDSHLIMKAKSLADKSIREDVLDFFKQSGIAVERIELLSPISSIKGHLEIYNQIDIGLDTFPYNGTTTTCEAIWMGVPVITLTGTTHASRVGISLLSNIGLPELTAKTPYEYQEIAVGLSQDLYRLQLLRNKLRNIMSHSPLMDNRRFVLNLEDLYRSIWKNWCQKDF